MNERRDTLYGETWILDYATGNFAWPEFFPPAPQADQLETVQGVHYINIVQGIAKNTRPTEGLSTSPVKIVRTRLTDYLTHRHSEAVVMDTVLAVNELVINALRPRQAEDPNQFDGGWCQLWFGEQTGAHTPTQLAILTHISSPEIYEKTCEDLRPTNAPDMAERGRGMPIVYNLSSEHAVALKPSDIAVEHTLGSLMLIQLAIPRQQPSFEVALAS